MAAEAMKARLPSILSSTPVDAARLDTHPDVELKKFGGCCSSSEYYVLNQTFAIVRHADRLDHTPDWKSYPDREAYPNDTPLTPDGFDHAAQVADILDNQQRQFKLVVASPYLRCAQTASCIARKLNVPVHFDLDLGEIFDVISMGHHCSHKAQHRSPEVLEEKLKPDFPDIEYVRDEQGLIKIEGKLQRFPEPFDGARIRFCYKVKKLVQQAAAELSSIVIVTHGDAVASVVGMLKESWIMKSIPYTAYAIGDRQVRVMKAKSKVLLTEEPVYVHPEQWKLQLDPGITHISCSRKEMVLKHAEHEKELQAIKKKEGMLHTAYSLLPHQKKHAEAGLDHLDVSAKDKRLMMKKAGTTVFAAGESSRIACGPEHDERLKQQKTMDIPDAPARAGTA